MENNVENAIVNFTPLTNKLVKDGKTAVLINSSWGISIEMFRYDPVVIGLILDKKKYKKNGDADEAAEKYNNEVDIFNDNINDKIVKYCHIKYDYQRYRSNNINWPNSLTVDWVPTGTFFMITNCGDNGESIITVQQDHWTKA